MDSARIYQTVNTQYSSIASQADSSGQSPASNKNTQIASSFGYTADELASLPAGTNLGLSCGNPLATANLQPHETMLDLGSGGGLDCIIAAQQMLESQPQLPTGKIYGVDRSEKMIALARRNAAKAGLPDGLAEFVEAPITRIPLGTAMVDLVVSNCVVNLVPDEDKPQVFREIYRLLKPGGRLAISDLLAKKPLPDQIRKDAALLVGCVAGASLVEDYRRWMVEAGFQEDSIIFVDTRKDLNVYHDQEVAPSCCGGGGEDDSSKACGQAEHPGSKVDFNEWVAAHQIYALKAK